MARIARHLGEGNKHAAALLMHGNRIVALDMHGVGIGLRIENGNKARQR